MQIVSLGDNLRDMSKPVFWENKKKYHQFVNFWISPESDKGQSSNSFCYSVILLISR